MEEAIKNFAKQFEYKPVIENASNLKKHGSFVVGGMGGSRLPALILKMWDGRPDIRVHNDYGLPESDENLKTVCLLRAHTPAIRKKLLILRKRH